jgi:hypothetical protein
MPENIASVRVLEKTGLRYAETVTSGDINSQNTS